jgi:predicted metal-dependent peptidase
MRSRAPWPRPNAEAILDRERRRVGAIRMQMLSSHPFWGYLLLESELIPSPGLPTLAATDGVRRIWYNPRLTCYLTVPELGFVLAHEVGHVVLQSLARRRGRDATQWNCASDYAVNRIVSRILAPGGRPLYAPPRRMLPGIGRIAPLLDDCFDGMTAEAIYEALGDNPLWDRPSGRVRVELLPCGGLADAGPLDPSHSGGRILRLDDRPEAYDLHLPPDDLDGPCPAGAGDDPIAAEVASRISRALEQADRSADPGNVPGEVRRAIAKRAHPRGDESWQDIFRRIVERSLTRDEYTWSRPHRRWLAEGFLVPGLRSDAPPAVVIALDTSASMSQSDLAQVCAEIRPVAARCGEAVLLVHDAAIQEVVHGCAAILRWLEDGWARGGGGTDHRPVFDWIVRAGVEPEMFVGLTDCASVYPATAPAYPVVWVTPMHSDRYAAPWGERLWVEPAPSVNMETRRFRGQRDLG